MTIRGRVGFAGSAAALAASLIGGPVFAAVTISSDATQDMSCSDGVCQPTASDAVLNVSDLENYLAAGNIEVTTTGSGVEASEIYVEAAVPWSSASVLSLVADETIEVDQAISLIGVGGLSVANDGAIDALAFGRSGNVRFASRSSSLTINGDTYTLENDIGQLAKDIAKNPSGRFALARSHDASQDRNYSSNPISTPFTGTFEGLGNSISHLSMEAKSSSGDGGFFYLVDTGGVVRDFGLVHARVSGNYDWAGGLATLNAGYILRCYVTGSVSERHSKGISGGLLGANLQSGTVRLSYSTASVKGAQGSQAGGLVGGADGLIDESFATGAVKQPHGAGEAGGLVGETSGGQIKDSYATGSVDGNNVSQRGGTYFGGLIGENDETIATSYSTGEVAQNECTGCYSGGLIGVDAATSGSLSYTFWDTDTSGISNPDQGAGYPSNDLGITGLSTQQFQSGLPSGFDPSIWAEDSKINGGLPYLISNPPPE